VPVLREGQEPHVLLRDRLCHASVESKSISRV
jgi:hypothetical protein